MKQIKWIKMDSFTGIFQRCWLKRGIFPGEVTMVIINRVKINAMKHGKGLWKCPIKENHIFYFSNWTAWNANMWIQIFFKKKKMDELDDKWYPIEFII